jgi:hypothetical protein
MKRYQFLISLLCVVVSWFWCQNSFPFDPDAPVQVISDIDDTIRIIHVNSYYQTVKNGLYSKSIFDGIKPLYSEFVKNGMGILYLSGSPQSLQNSLETLLFNFHGLPRGKTLLNNWWEWKSSADFKRAQLNLILKDSKSNFILIGDDTQSDPEVYAEFKSDASSSKILKIYIHQVSGRPLPKEVVGFSTAFDIALKEGEEQRLDVSQIVSVGQSILDNKNTNLLFPYFKFCPTHYESDLGESIKLNQELIQIATQMNSFIRNICIPKFN